MDHLDSFHPQRLVKAINKRVPSVGWALISSSSSHEKIVKMSGIQTSLMRRIFLEWSSSLSREEEVWIGDNNQSQDTTSLSCMVAAECTPRLLLGASYCT